jgi:hypothetical protein
MKMKDGILPRKSKSVCSLLDEAQLAALGELALRCEKVYGPRRDIIAKDALNHIPAGT